MTPFQKVVALLSISAGLAACAPATTMIGGANAGNGGLNPAQRLSVAQPSPGVGALGLTLSSPNFANGTVLGNQHVANVFGCSGGNVSPALSWTGVPAGTQALALTMYDPDAPTGSGFWHWAVFNIPPTAGGLAQGAAGAGGALPPGAIQLPTDAGTPGYLGPCPPGGDRAHRYVFTLYALSRPLDLPANTPPAILGFSLNGITLAKTSITAFYGR